MQKSTKLKNSEQKPKQNDYFDSIINQDLSLISNRGENPIETAIKSISETGVKIDIDILNQIISDAPDDDFAKIKAKEILKYIDNDNFIHPAYSETITGRYCSSSPNIQNTPKQGSKYAGMLRKALIARKGNVFVHVDISQAELRILAYLSEDNKLISLLSGEGDIHRQIAGEIFNIAPDDISDAQRSQGKATVFSMVYGASIFTVAQKLAIKNSEAKRIKDNFLAAFATLKKWIVEAKKNKYPRTIGGRYIPSGKSTTSINYAIQGSVADIINSAIVTLYSYGISIVYQGYDSIVAECPATLASITLKTIEDTLKNSYSLSVPITVKSTVGRDFNAIMPVTVIEQSEPEQMPGKAPNEGRSAKATADNDIPEIDKIGDYANILPKKPYCTDDLSKGLKVKTLKYAIEKKYLQINQPNLQYFLIFDVDQVCPVNYVQNKGLPAPTYQIANPENHHSHIIYQLRSAICTSEFGRLKPIQYAAAVENAYTIALNADIAYTGLIVKNPWHPYWIAQVTRAIYDLSELSKYVKLESKPNPQKITGLGRNCTVFNALRAWGYKEVRKFWESTYREWLDAVTAKAMEFNRFDKLAPLPVYEINAIAKSIAKWIWQKFEPETFKAIQKARIARRWRNDDTRKKALNLYEIGLAKAEICRACGIARSTFYEWLKQ